jgi:hypothetical protein
MNNSMYVKHPLRKCTEKVFGATILVIIPKQPYQISQLQYWAYTPFLVLFIQNLQPWGLYTIFLTKYLDKQKNWFHDNCRARLRKIVVSISRLTRLAD